MTIEEREEKINYYMDLYYLTKRQCNYIIDPDEIIRIWNQAKSYLDKAEEFKKIPIEQK